MAFHLIWKQQMEAPYRQQIPNKANFGILSVSAIHDLSLRRAVYGRRHALIRSIEN
jgi:hypothetical protein